MYNYNQSVHRVKPGKRITVFWWLSFLIRTIYPIEVYVNQKSDYLIEIVENILLFFSLFFL